MQAMKINQFDDKNMFFFTFSALFLLLCIFASTDLRGKFDLRNLGRRNYASTESRRKTIFRRNANQLQTYFDEIYYNFNLMVKWAQFR